MAIFIWRFFYLFYVWKVNGMKRSLAILLALLMNLNTASAVFAEDGVETVTDGQEVFLSEGTEILLTEKRTSGTEEVPYEEPVEEVRPGLEEIEVSTADDLRTALETVHETVTTVRLTENVSGIDATITVSGGAPVILDLNGHSITAADTFIGENSWLILNTGTLTVTGNGSLTVGTAEDKPVIALINTGNLTIENGTFRGAMPVFCDNGTVTIQGGTFKGISDVETFGACGGTIVIEGNPEFTGSTLFGIGSVYDNPVNLTIEGGTYTASSGLFGITEEDPSAISIRGGSFEVTDSDYDTVLAEIEGCIKAGATVTVMGQEYTKPEDSDDDSTEDETDPIGCTAEVLTDGELLEGELFGTEQWGMDDPEAGDRSYNMAFDGDISTFYDAADGYPGYHVGMDVGTSTRLTEVHIVPRNENGYEPQAVEVGGPGGYPGEDHTNLFDGEPGTVWCSEFDGESLHIDWQTEYPVSPDRYIMYTGYDTAEFPGRSPITWTLFATNDPEGEWDVLSEYEDNYELPDENCAPYEVILDELPSAEGYTYFKLVIDAVKDASDGNIQLGEFRLLEAEPESVDQCLRMNGMTVQGSTDGELWADLYTFSGDYWTMKPYVITADDMYYVNAYSFTQFRVINKEQHFNVAEVEFYGVDGSDLEVYPGTITGEHKLNDEAAIFGSEGSWNDEPDRTFDKAFDGNVHTFYDPADGEQEIGIRLGNPAKLTGLRVLPRIDSGFPINPVWIHEGTEGYENESYENLFDFDYDSKWCAPTGEDIYVIWEMGEAVAIDGYKLVTANDADMFPERNPSEWTLYGSDDGDEWNEIHTQTDAGLPAENFAEYSVELPERADSYSFYKLEITALAGDAGTVQLSEFILLYEGCNESAPDGWGDRMINLTVQGSVNGEDWISLYQFPDRGYDLTWYDISEDMLASAAQDYAFTQFRVINKADHLNVAEVEFYGTYDHDLDSFPTEIHEPIYSYIPAEQFVENYSHYDEWYFSDRDDDGMTRFEREFEGEDPVALIGGVGFDETDFVIDYVDGRPVFAVAPCAFTCENGIRNVIVDEGSPCRYILDNAFRGCENLETVTVSNSIYQIWCWAFNDTPKLREFIKADENLTNEEKDERGWLFVEVHDGVLTGYNRILLRYPQAKDYEPTYELPDFVEVIDHGAFCDAQIGKITMGDRVLEICNYAFSRSQAHTIELSPALKWLGNDVFAGCVNLTSLVIPSDDVEIDRWMDEDNDLTDDEFMFDPWMFEWTKHEERTENLRVTAYAGTVIEEYIDYIKSLEIEDYDMSHVEFSAYDGIHWLYGDWFEECEDDEVFLIGMSAPADALIGELPQYTEDGRRIIGVRGDTEWCGLCDKAYLGDENGTLVIPDSYRYIIRTPFPGCNNVTKLVLPASLEFSEFPVEGMLNLETFEIAENAEQYYVTDDGMAYYDRNGDHDYPVLAAYAVGNSRREDNPVTEFTVAEGTYEIHHSVFRDAIYLTTVNLPDSLVMIDSHAFRNSGLTEITLPASVELLLDRAFAECHDLTSVKIESLSEDFCNPERWWDSDWSSVFEDSENVTVYVYAGTRAEEVAREYGWPYETMEVTETIYDMYTANDGVHLAGVIPATVDGEQVTEFVIPEDVMIIDDEVFVGMNITSVTLPKTLIRIGHRAFAGCGDLFEVHFAGASMIGWEGDSFDEVVDFQTIYDEALFNNQHWDGNYLYYVMPEAREVMLRGYWYTAIDENGVMEIPSETVIDGETYYVTAIEPGSCEAGSADRLGGHVRDNAELFGWEIEEREEWAYDYPKSVIIPNTVRYIGEDAFAHHNYWDDVTETHSGLESVKLPQSVKWIERNAFNCCWLITEFTGLDAYGAESENPYRLTEGGSIVNVWNEPVFYAYPCGKTETSYTIPDGIVGIGFAAFNNAANLVTVTIPEGVRWTDNESFAHCSNLETVYIPSTLEDVSHGSFRGCNSLTDFILPKEAGENFFIHEDGTLRRGDDNAVVVVFPLGRVPDTGVLEISDDVVGIYGAAAAGSNRLTELVLPESIEWISDCAFEGSDNLRTVLIKRGEQNRELGFNLNVFAWNPSLETITYEGDVLEMWTNGDDSLVIRNEKDEFGNDVFDEAGNNIRVPFNLVVSETCDVRSDDFNVNDNPYFNLIRGIPAPLYGDVNGDGEATEEDALYLLRYTLLPNRYPLSEGDHNYDGSEDDEITAKDAAALKNNISNQ